MITIRTNKEIGKFLEYSKIDNVPIRTVESYDELFPQYTEGIDYELCTIMSSPSMDAIDVLYKNDANDALFNELKWVMKEYCNIDEDSSLKSEIQFQIRTYKNYIKKKNDMRKNL